MPKVSSLYKAVVLNIQYRSHKRSENDPLSAPKRSENDHHILLFGVREFCGGILVAKSSKPLSRGGEGGCWKTGDPGRPGRGGVEGQLISTRNQHGGKDRTTNHPMAHTVQHDKSSCVDHPRPVQPITLCPPRPTLHHGWSGRQRGCGGLGKLTIQPATENRQSDDSGSIGRWRKG